MSDGFWHKAWQFALLFAVIVMLGAAVVVQQGDLSPADVREIIAEQGLTGGGGSTAYPTDQSIRPVLTPVAELVAAPADENHITYAPEAPPAMARSDQRTWSVAMEVVEGVCPIDPTNGITTQVWGFRIAGQTEVVCGSPGPVLRGRVGDVVAVTLTNLATNTNPHNIDFHAVTGQGGGAAALTVNPGETASVQFRLLYPGVFMYHCAYGDIPVHISHGMYGVFIVDPETALPTVDHEWVMAQSEWYVSEPDATGFAAFDNVSLRLEEPRFVTFNGRTDALSGDNTLTMAVGERARIYFINEGLNLASNFHPIGSHWDAVYPEGATHQVNRVIRGSQTTLVVAGGGTVVELDLRQTREVEVTRLLDVDAPLAGQDIQRLREARAGPRFIESGRSKALVQVRRILGGVALAHLPRAPQLGRKIGRNLPGRRREPDGTQVERRGCARVACLRQLVGLHDQSPNVSRLERECLVDRSGAAGRILQVVTGLRKTEPDGRFHGSGRDRLREMFMCLTRLATAERLRAGARMMAGGLRIVAHVRASRGACASRRGCRRRDTGAPFP